MTTVFISVSGPLSTCIGIAIRNALSTYFSSLNTWIAIRDIDKGKSWRTVLADGLTKQSAGIIVLTARNQSSPWILYEAGAIAAMSGHDRVWTVLVDLKASDITGPLAISQHTLLQEHELATLASVIEKYTDRPRDGDDLKRASEVFAKEIMTMAHECLTKPQNKEEGISAIPSRDEGEVLGDVLEVVRDIQRQQSEMASRLPVQYPLSRKPGLTGATGPTGVVFGPQGTMVYPSGNPVAFSTAGGSTRATVITRAQSEDPQSGSTTPTQPPQTNG